MGRFYMSKLNSDRFIIAYNRIEKAMQDLTGIDNYMPYFRLIDRAKKMNVVIRKFETDLREFGELRNAIVHNRTKADYAIAEPHDEIVRQMEGIAEKLTKPITVGDMFRRKVHSLQVTDSLAAGLRLIREMKFNQIPIYDNAKFIGLVTANGITYWMADEMTEEIISREMPTLLDILNHEKQKNTFQFIKSALSIYEAEDFFKKAVTGGRRLEALLITQSGGPDEKLIGIITPLDLLRVE